MEIVMRKCVILAAVRIAVLLSWYVVAITGKKCGAAIAALVPATVTAKEDA